MTDSSLLFPSLEIRNYRAFRHLTISRLGRVNLIVGKNNIGKSSLLESILLYSREGNLRTIWSIAKSRKDDYSNSNDKPNLNEIMIGLQSLYYNRPNLKLHKDKESTLDGSQYSIPIAIGYLNDKTSTMHFITGWKRLDEDQNSYTSTELKYIPAFVVAYLEDLSKTKVYFLEDLDRHISIENLREDEISAILIPANGLTTSSTAMLYDKIAGTVLEDDIVLSLQIIEPNIQQLRFVPATDSQQSRQAIVRLRNESSVIPLADMGDGMQRLLGITLALVNSKDGVFIIDEIENGLHYSTLVKIWRVIFATARRLNIQVFATTHSDDCIRAFQQVSAEDKETEGILISLRRKEKEPHDIFAVISDEKQLTSAMELDMEVR